MHERVGIVKRKPDLRQMLRKRNTFGVFRTAFFVWRFGIHSRDATASRLTRIYKKSAFSIHALDGSPTTGPYDYMGEHALGGRVLLDESYENQCGPFLTT